MSSALTRTVISGDVSQCRRAQYRSAGDVEDGAVPGAGHFCPRTIPSERPARWVQVSSIAWNVLSTLKRAILFPPGLPLPAPHPERSHRILRLHELGHHAPLVLIIWPFYYD
jgi:hypothetical protein